MLFHHDDEQRSIPTATPVRPEGYGGVTPGALLPGISPDPLLGRWCLAAGATPPQREPSDFCHGLLGSTECVKRLP